MRDVISYCKSVSDFANEVEGTAYIAPPRTPVVYNGDESVCLIRMRNGNELELFENLERLGECIDNEYIFDSPEAQAIYERIYDTTTRMIDDGEVGQIEYTPPYKIGVFA